jgi:hypothetical protein
MPTIRKITALLLIRKVGRSSRSGLIRNRFPIRIERIQSLRTQTL